MKKCDGCGSLNTCVVDSREQDYAYVRRRRKCNNCNNCKSRWTTYEVTEDVYKTLQSSAVTIERLQQAKRAIDSALDVVRETLPPGIEEVRAERQFVSPNPRVKEIQRPPFVREVA